LCSARAREERSRCSASSSGEVAVRSGAAVSVAQPVRQGDGFGRVDFFFLCGVWLKASEPASSKDSTAKAATRRLPTAGLVLARWAGVGVFAESMSVAFRKDFHQPAVKVIHRVVHDGLKTAVVLSMGFVNVIT